MKWSTGGTSPHTFLISLIYTPLTSKFTQEIVPFILIKLESSRGAMKLVPRWGHLTGKWMLERWNHLHWWLFRKFYGWKTYGESSLWDIAGCRGTFYPSYQAWWLYRQGTPRAVHASSFVIKTRQVVQWALRKILWLIINVVLLCILSSTSLILTFSTLLITTVSSMHFHGKLSVHFWYFAIE